MYISEQLLDPSERRLRLAAQLGVERVVLDNRGSARTPGSDGGGIVAWRANTLHDYRRWVEGYGLKIDVFALDVGSILLDSMVDLDSAKKSRDILARNIAVAADAGLTCLKYNVPMVGMNAQAGWDAIEFLIDGLIPAADAAGVRLACQPHDPAYPAGGLNGVEHVLGSADGLRRFLALSSSRNHGLNFCQGTVAEMFERPREALIPVIEEFAASGRIFMVHFGNIDEGDIDMLEAIHAYRRGGYAGPLCPDHVPLSELDDGRERCMAFALGYTRGLLHAAGIR